MPVIPIKIETLTDEAPSLRLKQINLLLRHTHQAIGEFWRDKLLPEHFDPDAHFKFQYAQRRPKYLKRKARRGIRADLIWSGLLRRVLVQTKQVVTSSITRTNIHLVGPSYFKINYKPGRPHIMREVTTVNADHEERVTEYADRVFSEKLAQLRAATRTKTR